ncbi:Oxysterol-binding protein 9 [Gracilariopsis chorda]|uniref:Oxysterol-binding protein 9 n=1 Tax=Gracilariopsis chorda TaxID=448386 RepID=A0A2V3IFK2_9FLOR|nr:Oxysterol-binding protein 9 [Gracilariopsis chorda]|eukprot:PXF40854.1 Oxysterol-binding protein 9 [Gracilariopsis chorda]
MSPPPTLRFNRSNSKDDYRIDRASATGGLVFRDPKDGEMLRRSMQHVLQRVGSRVLQGNINFSGMALPVHMNEPRSVLERVTDDWAYAPLYLKAAAATSDPVERIKLVAAFVVSGLHCIDTLAKPFNPILGSTYQATLSDGTPCYIEQTSHHPPVTHYSIRPEDASYIMAGFSGMQGGVVWGLDTALSSRRVGINVVEFADGTRIVYTFPTMLLRALLSELKCEFDGPFCVMYEAHGLVFDFALNPPQPMRWLPLSTGIPTDYMDGVLYRLSNQGVMEEGSTCFTGAFAKKKGAFFGDPDEAVREANDGKYTAVELRSNAEITSSVTIAIQARNRGGNVSVSGGLEREILCYARGTFLGYLDIDGERVWDIREMPKGQVVGGDLKKALASDCRYREDVVVLKRALDENNDEAAREALTNEAQLLKEKLENIQRNDRKLRREGVLRETNEEDGFVEKDEGERSCTSVKAEFSEKDGQSVDGIGAGEEKKEFIPVSIPTR